MKNKLHPIVKKKWLEALRSGKYKQTKGMLRKLSTGGMCCIGVLCDVYETSEEYLNGNGMLPSSNIFRGKLPKSCSKINGETWKNLAKMNDSGKRFKTIANYIEKEL